MTDTPTDKKLSEIETFAACNLNPYVAPQGATFHWKDGLMFARGEGNYVHIWRGGGQDCEIARIPPDEWDSIFLALRLSEPHPSAIREAVEGEREACAALADARQNTVHNGVNTARAIAAAIRARGEEKGK